MATPEPEAERVWIVGNWVIEGEYCAGSAAIQLHENGEFFYDIEDQGTWRFDGEKLTITVNGQTSAQPVERVGPDEMRLGDNRMRRCAPGGGKEPWFPGANFTTK